MLGPNQCTSPLLPLAGQLILILRMYHILPIYSLVGGHLDYHFLAITNIMGMLCKVFCVNMFLVLGLMPGSTVAGSLQNFNFEELL